MRDPSLGTPGLALGALETSSLPANRTAVTGFVGVSERGPLHRPQTLRSFGEFQEVFGGVEGFGCLAKSAYAFFLNGGEEACVVRVGGPLPPPAWTNTTCVLQEPLAAASGSAIPDASGNPTLHLRARSEGAWGNRLLASVSTDAAQEMDLGKLTAAGALNASQIEVDYIQDYREGVMVRLTHLENAFLRSVHEVTAIHTAQRRLTLSPPLPRAYPAGSLVRARGFRLEVSDGVRREVFDGLSMNPSHPRYFVDVINSLPEQPFLESAREGHSLLVSAERVLDAGGSPRFRPAGPTAVTFTGGGDGVTFARGELLDSGHSAALRAAALLKGHEGNGLQLRAEPFEGRLALPVPATPGGMRNPLVLEDIRGWTAGDTVVVTHALDPALQETRTVLSVDVDRHELTLTSALTNDHPLGSPVSVAARFNLFIEPPGQPRAAEPFFNLSLTAGPRFFKDLVNRSQANPKGSRLVCVDTAPAASGPPSGTVRLGGGVAPEETPLPHLLGYDADGSLAQFGGAPSPLGLAALELVPEVNLVCVPDLVYRQDLARADILLGQRQLLSHCEQQGDRFALLDVPRGLPPELALEWPDQFSDSRFARFGALYYPWLSMAIAGADRWLPPSGAVAGLIAQADRREGVGRAPANLTFKGVVELERDLEATEQGELNLRGVNCIRKFEVGAIRLWGARTLSREEDHRYVHNRRVVLLTLKALSRNLRWAVFEPNDAGLRQRIKDSIEGYLRGLLAQGLTAGGRPEDAFYVKVDETMNDADTLAAGQVLAEVGLALSRPTEFIVITVKRRPETLTLVEEEA